MAEAQGSRFRDHWRQAYASPWLVLPLLLAVASTWGQFDALSDADGDRPGGMLIMVAPSVLCAWTVLALIWRARGRPDRLLIGILFGCLLVQVPLVVIDALGALVVWMLPGDQAIVAAATAANHDFHYWGMAPGEILALSALGGYAISGAVALGVVLIVVAPVVATWDPVTISAGSRLEGTSRPGIRHNPAAWLFWGLSLLCLGLVLVYFLGEGYGFDELPRWIEHLHRYEWSGYDLTDSYDREMTFWIAGMVLIVAGILLMLRPLGIGLVRMIREWGRPGETPSV